MLFCFCERLSLFPLYELIFGQSGNFRSVHPGSLTRVKFNISPLDVIAVDAEDFFEFDRVTLACRRHLHHVYMAQHDRSLFGFHNISDSMFKKGMPSFPILSQWSVIHDCCKSLMGWRTVFHGTLVVDRLERVFPVS